MLLTFIELVIFSVVFIFSVSNTKYHILGSGLVGENNHLRPIFLKIGNDQVAWVRVCGSAYVMICPGIWGFSKRDCARVLRASIRVLQSLQVENFRSRCASNR